MSEPCCFNCVCFVPVRQEHDENMDQEQVNPIPGICRYYPPAPCPMGRDDKLFRDATWPIVVSSDWCSYHRSGSHRQPINGPLY